MPLQPLPPIASAGALERLSVARHLHTANHDKPSRKVSIADIATRYQAVDAIVIEDHGKFQSPSSPRDADPGPMVLPGCEWATPVHPTSRPKDRHHVGILGVDAREQAALDIRGTDAPDVMRRKVHQAGGALVYNHPEYPYIHKMSSRQSLAYSLPRGEAREFDAIELFNDVGFKGGKPAEVLTWVERTFYDRGLYPAMVGGQDDHGPSPVAPEPTYTMAMVDTRDEGGLMEAIREGRTYVSKSLDAHLRLDLDGRSAWERQGTLAAGTHHLSVGLRGLPPGAVVEVVRSGKVIARAQATAGDAAVSLALTTAASGRSDYVYVRAWSAPGRLHTVSSAVPLSE